MKQITIYLFATLTLFLVACNASPASPAAPLEASEVSGKPVSVAGGEYRDVSVAEMEAILVDKDFLFVNVHIPFEGDLPDTDLSIPFDEIAQNLDQLPVDKNAKIVLYCRSGRMSAIAAEELVGLGYTNIWNLDGGFNAWQAAGLPLEGE